MWSVSGHERPGFYGNHFPCGVPPGGKDHHDSRPPGAPGISFHEHDTGKIHGERFFHNEKTPGAESGDVPGGRVRRGKPDRRQNFLPAAGHGSDGRPPRAAGSGPTVPFPVPSIRGKKIGTNPPFNNQNS